MATRPSGPLVPKVLLGHNPPRSSASPPVEKFPCILLAARPYSLTCPCVHHQQRNLSHERPARHPRFDRPLRAERRGLPFRVLWRDGSPHRVHQSLLQMPRLGHGQHPRLRRSLQGCDPRGRLEDRRRHQGPGLQLPHWRTAQILPRSQKARSQHQRRPCPRLPAAPLRLVGQAAVVDPHRLRGVRRLRLPPQARPDRQSIRRPRPIFHL